MDCLGCWDLDSRPTGRPGLYDPSHRKPNFTAAFVLIAIEKLCTSLVIDSLPGDIISPHLLSTLGRVSVPGGDRIGDTPQHRFEK